MPEMPEVETIRRTLEGYVVGKVIKDVDIRLTRLIKWPAVEEFKAIATGRSILALERRAKYLLFHLNDGWIMVVHLRMTGRLNYQADIKQSNQAARLVFAFAGGDALEYFDTRTFGTLYLLHADELDRIYGLSSLGPEPLSSGFTVKYMAEKLAKRKGKLKSILLDQRFIGGLGNIYVDESLAIAGIHPEMEAAALTLADIERLHSAINSVIEKGICSGGTSFRDYRDADGNRGAFQESLCVYGRKGLPCIQCGTEIVRIEVGGRGTHFCPQCQQKNAGEN